MQKNSIRKTILLFLPGTIAATGKLFGTEEILCQVDPRLDERSQEFDLACFFRNLDRSEQKGAGAAHPRRAAENGNHNNP